MLASEQIEELITVLSTWDRPMLMLQFSAFTSNFPIDFTPEYLRSVPVEKLRHVFLAMCLQNQRMPEMLMASAAA